MTSATTAIDGSPMIESKSVVSTPSGAGNSRAFSTSRTSARTTRSRCPVARSMSSPFCSRKRATDEPTVPYPRRATGTSTDAIWLLLDPVHQRPELLPDLLDPFVGRLRAQLVQVRLAPVHLGDPLLREDALPDVGEELAHVLAHLAVDDARAAGEIAVLGRVGDRVAHAGKAALPHQVDDQLQLVQALVVRDLRLVAGLDERLEAEPHELGDAAAEDRLLAEEIGLGLLGEAGLDHSCAPGADPGAVGERQLEGVPARVLLHGDDRRRAVALGEEPADDVA